MKDSTKRQIKSGFRWGGGLAIFLIAILPLVDGLRRTVWAARGHQQVEPVGWSELVMAAVLLAATAPIWVYYLLGCMLIGAVKVIALIVAGTAGTPSQIGEVFLFVVGTSLLLVIIVSKPITLFDRMTLTAFVFSVAWRGDDGLFVPAPSLLVGLMFLFASGCAQYLKSRRTAVSKW